MKLVFFLMLCLLHTTAWAAGAVQIESAEMSIDHLHNQAEFKGGVHLMRDDFDLRCDRLLAYYSDNELQRAEAFGRVRMQQGGKRGASDKAIFDQPSNTLILLGDASVEDKDGVVRGDKITHDIHTEQTQVIQGEGNRVHLNLESDTQAGQP